MRIRIRPNVISGLLRKDELNQWMKKERQDGGPLLLFFCKIQIHVLKKKGAEAIIPLSLSQCEMCDRTVHWSKRHRDTQRSTQLNAPPYQESG